MILSLVTAAWRGVQSWVVGAAIVAAAVLAVYSAGGRNARHKARADALRQDIDRREVRDEVDRAVAREPEPVERLRDRWSRD